MNKEKFLTRASRPAAAVKAQGVARIVSSRDEIRARAAQTMRNALETTRLLMREGPIPEPPKGA